MRMPASMDLHSTGQSQLTCRVVNLTSVITRLLNTR